MVSPLFFSLLLLSDQPILSLKNVNFREGFFKHSLNIPAVQDMAQDATGFLWIGTQNGLFRYDGNEVKPFGSNEFPKQALPNQLVRCLYVAADSSLWVGTETGLCRLNEAEESFDLVPAGPLQKLAIRHILKTPGGDLWIGTNQGLFLLKQADLTLEAAASAKQVWFENQVITALDCWEQKLVVGTNEGVRFIDLDDLQEISIKEVPKDGAIYGASVIDGQLWLGFYEHTLRQTDTGPWETIAVDAMRDAFAFKNGIFLCSNTPTFYQGPGKWHPVDQDILTTYDGFVDRDGLFWLGTFQKGIFKLNPQALKIDWLAIGMSTWAIGEDADQHLWFGSAEKGVLRRDPQTGQTIAMTHDSQIPSSLPHDRVTSFLLDQNHRFWIGTHKGLALWQPETASFKRYQADEANPLALSEKSVWCLAQGPEQQIYVGTAYGGLNLFDPQKETFQRFQSIANDPKTLSSNFIRDICRVSKDTLWLATNKGVNVFFEPAGHVTEVFRHDNKDPNSLSHDYVSAIFQDTKGNIWVATYVNGFQKYRPKDRSFTRYGKQHGLTDLCVYGIMEDAEGYLWMSTNKGLARFDPKTERIDSYFEADGVLGSEFNQGSYFQDARGSLFFGGTHGVSRIQPNSSMNAAPLPTPTLTGLRIFNEPKELHNQDRSYLQKPLYLTKTLELSHLDAMVGLELAALSFADPDSTGYLYRLEGHDPRWIASSPGQKVATYSHLDPGTYHFWAKSISPRHPSSPAAELLKIKVHPPFWKTWWFRTLGIALLLYLLYLIHRMRLRYAVGLERLRTQIVRDIHDDVGCRITQIATKAQFLPYQGQVDQQTANTLTSISENAQALITDFSDMVWLLDRDNDSGENLIHRMKYLLSKLFDSDQVTFSFKTQGPVEEIRWHPEARHDLYLIYKEALANIAKHAAATHVEIQLIAYRKHLTLRVKDNGRGFSENMPHGNGIRNIRNRAQRLKADIKYHSQKGCFLEVCLPIP